jgi:hypothetical protein
MKCTILDMNMYMMKQYFISISLYIKNLDQEKYMDINFLIF